jgi:hypothetical protein
VRAWNFLAGVLNRKLDGVAAGEGRCALFINELEVSPKVCILTQMNLTEEQRQRVSAWILEGAKLSEIQNRLLAEFKLKFTYMEVRFLVDDLKLTPKDPDPPKVVAPPAADPAKLTVEKNPAPEGTLPASGVSVSVDQIAKPGTVVSGKVTFSDGQAADWYLDQTGRLGVVPQQAGYKPSAADVKDFQLALQQEVARLGY